jgi:signal peptide peptidase SppA
MKHINYPHIASMVFNTPLMCTPLLLDAVQQALMPRLTANPMSSSTAPALLAPRYEDYDAEAVAMRTVGGVAVLPVHGILTTRRGAMDASCMEISSYEKIGSLLEAALNSSAVEHIVLDMNTPGGAAVGCFDFAERVYQARGVKPITAIVNFSAYSAGYMIASAADEIIVSTTSGVGSIGVIAAHVDLSKALDNDGLKITTFYRGDHKNDLSPYAPLTDTATAALNASLDELYALFVDSVARNRHVSAASIRDTQAGLFTGAKAISAGLADKLMHPQDAVNQIAANLAQRNVSRKTNAGRIGMQAAAMQMQL